MGQGFAVTDEELVSGILEQKKKFQREFVDRYHSNMYSIAYRYLWNREDTEDILQESFLKAFQKIGQFEGRSSIKTWLTSIVINECYMKLRVRSRLKKVSLDEMEFIYGEGRDRSLSLVESSPWRQNVNSYTLDKRKIVRHTIRELPKHYQRVIVLKHIEGYPNRDIADILGITIESVKSRLHRARTRIKFLLKRKF